MAKLRFPLLSLSAVGHFSKNLTFYSHSRRSYVMQRGQRIGFNIGLFAGFGRMPLGTYLFGYSGRIDDLNNSFNQILQRSLFSACWIAYAELTNEQKELLNTEAIVLGLSGANLFMSRYLKENN